jgi:peroxiredoxin
VMRDRPFFETITIEKGIEYTGQVFTPAGKPAIDVPYLLVNCAEENNHSPRFTNEYQGRTNAEGRFRLRMPKSRAVALYVTSPQPAKARFPYAPYQHFWGTLQPDQNPDVWAPTDFGQIVLERGVRLSGRLIDTEDRPIAGQTITAYPVRGEDRHSATTEADGSFVLGPLRHANYRIFGERQRGESGNVDPYEQPFRSWARVIKPVKFYLAKDVVPEPLVLREVPTVRIEVRFVDSQGRPVSWGTAKVSGLIPNAQGMADPFGDFCSFGEGLPSEINDPEPRDTSDRIDWSVRDRADGEGRIVFRVPEGLQHAALNAFPADETIAYKTRLEEHRPLKYWGGGLLGTLGTDGKITIVSYRAPTVVITVKTDDNRTPETKVDVRANFIFNLSSYSDSFVREADGRFRSKCLMPDHEYRIIAESQDYVPKTVPRLKLAEGGFTELTLILRKRPKPPEVGKPAPPFSVRTLDGSPLRSVGLRGRFVLLYFWAPNAVSNGLADLPHLKVVADRFGTDDRFTMIGLCLVDDPEVAARIITVSGLSGKQAILRDYGLDPIAVAYNPFPTPKSFVIGPNGTLLAANLSGFQIEKSVTEALGRK